MSWWDTKQLTSFATQALKTAQKKIDKVLDIKEDPESTNHLKDEVDDNFFSKWLSPEGNKSIIDTATTKLEIGQSAEKLNFDTNFLNVKSEPEDTSNLILIQETNTDDKSPALKNKNLIISSRSAFKKVKTKETSENILECNVNTYFYDNEIQCTENTKEYKLIDKTPLSLSDDIINNANDSKNINLELDKGEPFMPHEQIRDENDKPIQTFQKISFNHNTTDDGNGVKVDRVDVEDADEGVNDNNEYSEKSSNLDMLTSRNSDVDFSKCWSDASLSQMITSAELEIAPDDGNDDVTTTSTKITLMTSSRATDGDVKVSSDLNNYKTSKSKLIDVKLTDQSVSKDVDNDQPIVISASGTSDNHKIEPNFDEDNKNHISEINSDKSYDKKVIKNDEDSTGGVEAMQSTLDWFIDVDIDNQHQQQLYRPHHQLQQQQLNENEGEKSSLVSPSSSLSSLSTSKKITSQITTPTMTAQQTSTPNQSTTTTTATTTFLTTMKQSTLPASATFAATSTTTTTTISDHQQHLTYENIVDLDNEAGNHHRNHDDSLNDIFSISQSTSGITLTGLSSVENSSYVSDDTSDSNKTIIDGGGSNSDALKSTFLIGGDDVPDRPYQSNEQQPERQNVEINADDGDDDTNDRNDSDDISIQNMLEDAIEDSNKISTTTTTTTNATSTNDINKRVNDISHDHINNDQSQKSTSTDEDKQQQQQQEEQHDEMTPTTLTPHDNSSINTLIGESGMASGHTSADEIDTTTSSDIEVISQMSTPSFLGSHNRQPSASDKVHLMGGPGGGMGQGYCDLSPPSKQVFKRTGSPHMGHRRSDSGSSNQSLQSRNGEDFVSLDCIRSGFVDVRHRKHINGADSQHNQIVQLTNENDHLMKKLAEVIEILEAREKKVLELSQENLDLQEGNSILRNQLNQSESTNEAEKEDLKSVADEFTKRIAESEKKLNTALRDRDALKRALQESEMERKSDNAATEKVIKEKEQTITELLAEGEKLSKQQLQTNNIVKKLRTKDKENETIIKNLKQKSEDQGSEITKLEGILNNMVDNEKKNIETINQLSSSLKTNEEEINKLKNDLEDALEKARSFKSALDNSYKEMSELHRARMSDMTEAQKMAVTMETSTREQLMQTMEEQKMTSKKVESQLNMQIEDLQLTMSRMEKEHSRREDGLKEEISDLQLRMQEAEERNQELTQSVSTATRPLLRQIENIQMTFQAQVQNFEKIERNLSDRLSDAQSQLVSAIEKERVTSEMLSDTSARLNAVELQVSSLRQDKARLQVDLEMERSKLGVLDENKHMLTAQKDAQINRLEDELKELKKEKMLLENQVELEKLRIETERKKYNLISDQLKEKEVLLHAWSMKTTPLDDRISLSSTSSTPVADDYQERLSLRSLSIDTTPPQTHNQHHHRQSSSTTSTPTPSLAATPSPGMGVVTMMSNKQSVYDSFKGLVGTSVVENLQSQLKLKEGDILQLQAHINDLERTRESLSRELVKVTMLNEDLQDQVDKLNGTQKRYQEVDQRYNALLQMYGEKLEEIEELKMDLHDIKDIYKCQMDEILKLKSQTIPS